MGPGFHPGLVRRVTWRGGFSLAGAEERARWFPWGLCGFRGVVRVQLVKLAWGSVVFIVLGPKLAPFIPAVAAALRSMMAP